MVLFLGTLGLWYKKFRNRVGDSIKTVYNIFLLYISLTYYQKN